MPRKVLFLTLRIFSATGGIEKVCRVAGKALYELSMQYGGWVRIFSMYGKKDKAIRNNYFPQTVFTGFNHNKIMYVLKSIIIGRSSNVVLMSHINLLLVGIMIKIFNPAVKLVMITHGIEVWRPVAAWKKYLFGKVDLFLPVSHFTKDKMQSLHGIREEKISVLNNCLDPLLERPLQKVKAGYLLERYGLKAEHQILLTVSRMADTEQYKGYDRVLEALPDLVEQYPNLRYLMVGKYDNKEKQRIDAIINKLGLQHKIVFTGFVADEEMSPHFNLADILSCPAKRKALALFLLKPCFMVCLLLPVIKTDRWMPFAMENWVSW